MVSVGGSLHGGVAGRFRSFVCKWFWVVSDGFCWLRIISDCFRSFAVLVVTPILQNTEELFYYYTHDRT